MSLRLDPDGKLYENDQMVYIIGCLLLIVQLLGGALPARAQNEEMEVPAKEEIPGALNDIVLEINAHQCNKRSISRLYELNVP